jgi:hypothetical protein
MNSTPFHVDRHADRKRANQRRPRVASTTRPEWLETAEAGILYFGVTLLPLLVVILLHQCGVIA